MAIFHVPDDGLTLIAGQHGDKPPPPANASVQIMRLNLAQNTTERILKTLRNDEHVKLRLGKQVSLDFGKTAQHIRANADSFPSELFLRNTNRPELLYFSGKLSHTLEVQKAQQATEHSDEALAALQNSLKSMQEQRASNEASFITNKDDVRQLTSSKKALKTHRPSPLLSEKASAFRKDHLMSGITRSTPSSPFLSASFPLHSGPTSAPLLSSTTNKDKIRMDAIRIPLIHLLAVRPLTPKTIAQNLQASKEDVDKLLDKVANDFRESTAKKELKDKSYKDLDVWKFPYPSQEDRQAAIDRAVHAFDRLRVGRSDNLWQLLLPEERRGKGECLSKLNFDQPVTSIRTPKLTAEPLLSGTKGDLQPEVDADTDRGRLTSTSVSAPRTQSQTPVHKKRVSEKEALSKQQMRKKLPEQAKRSASKPNPTQPVKKTKQVGKFKSAEKIQDSDEEMEEAMIAPSGPQSTSKEKAFGAKPTLAAANSSKPASKPAAKKSPHRSQLSNSSVAHSNTSVVSDNQSLKPHPHQRSDNSPRGLSPRPRNGSSPHKPSPLASSPPENANDPDTSSTSKSSNSSTEASSPPSSTDLRNVKATLNGLAHKRNPPSLTKSPLKRKADSSEDDPTSKRHQANGISHKPLTNGSSSYHPPPPPPHPQRKISESEAESASSPEKGEQAKVLVYEKSRKFKDYYRRYKELHAKVTTGDQTDGEAIKRLNTMHDRIAALKREIWDDWKKLNH